MPKSKREKRSKSKSGYVGVRKKLSGKYEATVWIDGKIKNLGSSYDTAKQAAKAHDKEAIKLRKPFSTLNFPKKAPVGYTPIQQALYSHNTVGYRGVYKNGKNFIARIKIKIKKVFVYKLCSQNWNARTVIDNVLYIYISTPFKTILQRLLLLSPSCYRW